MMELDSKRYWPFDVPPADKRTKLESCEIRFMEQAALEGFTPYKSFVDDFGASSKENGRVVYIIVRGRNRWEIWLGVDTSKVLSIFVDDFDCAADCALRWLRGQPF